jgi:pimeloyl-ACP methyl ester carboxylesterase
MGDVLGWSMGSMIAQALAVLHPGQVNRLVLCASWPGNGQADPPSQQTLNADTTGDLFPAGQTAAQNTYVASISSYPAVPAVPAAIAAAQGKAIDQWWAGRDPAVPGPDSPHPPNRVIPRLTPRADTAPIGSAGGAFGPHHHGV